MKHSLGTRALRRAGRPRALTLDEIVDAAIEIGRDNLSMPAVAARLGTATATLYNYVANRDELMRLASLKQVRQPSINDTGQCWRELVRCLARRSFEFWAFEPQMIVYYMQGSIGPDLLIDYIEAFLSAMARRGFEPNNSYRLMSIVNSLVFGALVRHACQQSLLSLGEERSVAAAVAARNPEELRNIRACPEFTEQRFDHDLDAAVEQVIASFAPVFDR